MCVFRHVMLAVLLFISIDTIARSTVNNRSLVVSSKAKVSLADGIKKDTTSNLAPRNGKYLIVSQGSGASSSMKIGYFALSGNEYIYYDLEGKQLGEGTYSYDSAEKQVKWQSGPFKAIGWDGDFEVENNGKTHTIRLKSTTVATNSIE